MKSTTKEAIFIDFSKDPPRNGVNTPLYGQFTDYQKVKLPIAHSAHTPVVNPLLTNRVQMPMPHEFNGKKYYGVADVAKIIGVTQQTVSNWNSTLYFDCPLFTADERAHDGRYLYEVERVMQLKAVYHPNWTRGGYEPSPTTSEFHPISNLPPVANDRQTVRGKKSFKKISTTTLEVINCLSPDELETHSIIQRARASGYVCPLCGSGSGSHGTGMALNKKIETHTSFTCFSGSHSFNVLKLCALHYGLDTRANYPQLVEKICADFDIPLEYDEFTLTAGKRSSKQQNKRRENISPEELKNIQADLNASTDPLKTFIKYQPNQKWRGFDFDFLVNHGCRLINDWYPPKTRNTNQKFSTPTMRMIVPVGDSSYLARLVNQVEHYDIKARPFIKEKVHAGHKKLFGADVLSCAEPIFCFEGYFDAMSAELAGFRAVALGGCGEGNLLCSAIDNLNSKSQIIILFDPDKAGRDAAFSLREDLLAIKCPCVVRFLSKFSKEISIEDLNCASGSAVLTTPDKIDANSILQKQGVDVLRSFLQEILDDSLSELRRCFHKRLSKECR